MSLEAQIVAIADTLFAGRVFGDRHPEAEAPDFSAPFLIFQQVGGRPSNSFCGNTDQQNAIIQFTAWADDSQAVRDKMRSLEKLLTDPPLRGVSQGSAFTRDGPATRTFGMQQDFSFWHTP